MPSSLQAVHPELRRATAQVDRLNRVVPRPLLRTLARVLPTRRVDGVTVAVERVGSLKARVYRPRTTSTDGALLWIHGGGFVVGDARQDHALCAATALRTGAVVVSANYRLAPEHPFPAAHDDVHAAWGAILERRVATGIDPARVVVGGESAGAGLAAALAQRIRDEGGVQPVGQWLFAPMLDDRTAARRELDAAGHLVWDNVRNLDGWRSYLAAEPGGEAPRYAVPARTADLAGLPPAYLAWGDIELFAAEDASYAAALRTAGVDVVTDVVPGAPHGFENWARTTGPARQLLERAHSWLEARWPAPTPPG